MPSDYQRVAQAIAFVSDNLQQQPGLAQLAEVVGLSEAHFSRLFRRWAGIGPKRFLEQATVSCAKGLLRQRRSVLDSALEVGLSSPGRLHDHFVQLEAMSPGEFKRSGQGVDIGFDVGPSPFGDALVATTKRGLCGLFFVDRACPLQAERLVTQRWPQAQLRFETGLASSWLPRIFAPRATGVSSAALALHVRGTNFQLQVWRALLRIPEGQLTTYQAVAKAIGRPRAVRAVGNAVGANPVAWIIPCHRVIRDSGALGGYRWGLTRKQVMLAWEGLHSADPQPAGRS